MYFPRPYKRIYCDSPGAFSAFAWYTRVPIFMALQEISQNRLFLGALNRAVEAEIKNFYPVSELWSLDQ
jgi:hypothetical protein